jgi:heptosyltransferase III
MDFHRRGTLIHSPVSAAPQRSKLRWRIRRVLRELRGRSRYRLGRAAAALIGQGAGGGAHLEASQALLEPAQVRSVLICRINARMGNTMFLTPLIQQLRKHLPHASIDVATAYPKAADLLGPIPGVRRVILFPYKGVQLAWRYVAALSSVRREQYDLVIDPAADSTSDRIVALAARTRYRLGFAGASQWLPLTHAVAMPEKLLHQAVQPIHLLSRALGATWEREEERLQLMLSAREIEAGRAAVEQAIEAQRPATIPRRCVSAGQAFGFFAHATGLKTIGSDYWRAFWDAFLDLEPAAIPIEILPSPGAAPTDGRAATLHFASPRALAAAMACMRMFVSGDTGPMHLASSTDVPTVGLFHASDPALYGPLKRIDCALDLTRCPPAQLARHCREIWRRPAPAAGAA